jgi:hypothetical protein
MLEEFSDIDMPVWEKYIKVAPDGLDRKWNTRSPNSSPDDVTFIGKSLIDYLVGFSNVQPDFKLLGHSNGAGLTNQLLIANHDPRITAALTNCGILQKSGYNDGIFFFDGMPEASITPGLESLTRRKLVQVTGARDLRVPAAGSIDFNAWTTSAYAYAQAYGYEGPQASVTDYANYSRVSYVKGQVKVQAFNFNFFGHVIIAATPEGKPVLRLFLR